jgi:hypothetical protein
MCFNLSQLIKEDLGRSKHAISHQLNFWRIQDYIQLPKLSSLE